MNVEQLRLLLLLHSLLVKLMLVCRWGQVLVVLLTLQSVGGKMCGRIELVIAVAVGFCVKDLLLLGRLTFRSTPDLSHLVPPILHQGLNTAGFPNSGQFRASTVIFSGFPKRN